MTKLKNLYGPLRKEWNNTAWTELIWFLTYKTEKKKKKKKEEEKENEKRNKF